MWTIFEKKKIKIASVKAGLINSENVSEEKFMFFSEEADFYYKDSK
jgi:hypothetical protein